MKIIIYYLLFISILSYFSISYSFALNGTGTKDDPYKITNISELQSIQSLSSQKKYFLMMNNIDASETGNWNVGDHDNNPNTPAEPMGFMPISFFSGNFDGNGYIIYNLFINRPKGNGVGLFENIWGMSGWGDYGIFRLGIENCDITGLCFVGSLCGICRTTSIENCYTTGIVKATDTSAGSYVGGFSGANIYCSIRNCYSNCNVYSQSHYDNRTAGFNENQAEYTIEHCYFTGKVVCPKKAYIFQLNEKSVACFWDVETTGIPDSIPDSNINRARGLPTSEMKKKATYVNSDWDFDSVWCIDEGKDYPKLRAFGKCPPTDVPQLPKYNGNKIELEPNPATNKITIEFPSEFMSNARVSIFDMLGNELLTQNTYTKRIEFNCTSLPNGFYFCVVKSGSNLYSGKFVVVK